MLDYNNIRTGGVTCWAIMILILMVSHVGLK